MATIAKLDVILGLSKDGFDRGLDSTRGKLNSWGESFRSVGTKMTAGVTAPLALMGWQALQSASSLDQAQGKVDAVFGDSANVVKDWSTTTTNAFGISQTAALQSAGTMGNFFTSAGLALDQSAQYSTKLVELSGDMAAFNDVSASRASEALISGMAGEYDSLQRLGVNITAAKVETEALAIATADGRTEITEADLALARYNVIMEESKNQHGQAAREYDNFSSKLARMRARVSDLAAKWGNVLMPVALDFLGVIEDLLSWVENLSPSMQRWAIIIAAVAAAMGPLLIAIGLMLPGLSVLLGVVAALLSPLGLLIAAAGLLAYAFRDELGAALDWVMDKISEFTDIWNDLRDRGLSPIQAALAALQMVFPALGAVIAPVRQMVENLGDAFEAIKRGDYASAMSSIGAALRNIGSAAKALLDMAWEAVQSGISLAWDAITSLTWSDFIAVVAWGDYLDTLLWATYVTLLSWGDYLVLIVWSELITPLLWGIFVVSLTWADYVESLVWDFFLDLLTWGTFIDALSWTTFVNPLGWADYVRVINWTNYVNPMAWGTYIVRLAWNTYIASLVWDFFLDLLTWDNFVDLLQWSMFIVSLSWASYIDISWSDFIPALEWPSKDDIISAIVGAIGGNQQLPTEPVIKEGDWKDTQDPGTADQGWDDFSAGNRFGGLTGLGASLGAAMSQAIADAAPVIATALDSIKTGTITPKVAEWGSALQAGLTPLGPIAATSFGAVNTSAGAQLGMASASVAANTSQMSATSTANLGSMAANGVSRIVSMASSVTSGLSGMRGTAVSTVASMGSSVGSSMASMSATSSAQVLGMKIGIAASMLSMSSSATSAANSTRSGVVSAMTSMAIGAASAVASGMGAIPGIIASIGGSAAGTAYSVGASISQGMAAGMLSALGAIISAANQMVAAAQTALVAKAMIASPSKLFARYGEYVGEGFAQGIESTTDRVARATAGLVDVPDATARGGAGSGEVRQYFFALTSDEFRALLAKAEKGSTFAEGFADELGMREGMA